ncbi:MAG: nucleotide-binding protein [Calothrix sp. MO_167.B42]|nr:nucleotide-binding protein [Calothrix sp. MO_167.B42]
MISSFSQYLYQFALSVDLVNQEIIDNIREIIWQYLNKPLGLCFTEELHPTKVNNEPGLTIIWGKGTDQKGYSNVLKKPDGSYYGQASYAYAYNKPMWIVDGNSSPLYQTENYEDYWSKSTDIPKYWKFHEHETKTSIMIPLKISQSIYGIWNLESVTHLEFDKKITEELLLIAKSLALLLNLYNSTERRLKCTKEAVENLKISSERLPLKFSENNTIFLASSSKAKRDVIGAIRNVLDQFSSYKIVYWKEISDSGNINEQIINAINSSSFGIVYLSEPNMNHDYQDNPNTLFESGMFQALSNEPSSPVFGWIPIREKEGLRIPFDLASDRILIVPRLKTGELNSEYFCRELKERIDALIIRN